MENILLVLPKEWKIEKLRYLQGPVPEPVILNMDELPTPLDSDDSWLNHKLYPVKRNGPTGWPEVKEKPESSVQLCEVDGCGNIAVWTDPDPETGYDLYLCNKHMRP